MGPAVWPQVYELPGGVDASVVWNEAAMLRQAVGPRIVPLYGIAVQVGGAGWAGQLGCLAWAAQAPDGVVGGLLWRAHRR